jgi:beta-lactam-binding protein with PASTA domain
MVMPNLKNKSPNEAVAALQDQGWKGDGDNLSRSTTPVTNPGLVGAIISQSPDAGSVVAKAGTAVQVQIGAAVQISIPDVVGKTDAEARAAMNGIPNVTFAIVGGTPPGKAGTVQGQTAGGQVDVGTPVTVNIYGPEAAPASSAPASAPPAAAPPAAAPPAGNSGPGGGPGG